MLLFLQVALYLVFALNVSGDPGVNLLAVIVITSCLIFFKGFFGQIYKKWFVEIIEMICLLNVALFSAATLYSLEAGRDRTTVVYISGTITFIQLLVVLAYHMSTEICLKCWNSISYKFPKPEISGFTK